MVPVVALVAGVLLVAVGGTWAAVPLTGDDRRMKDTKSTKDTTAKKSPTGSPSSGPTGPVYPYGEQVGLTKPLQAGDCVKAVWSGAAFKSALNLGVVNGAKDWPDGQVVAGDTADDYADALAHGAQRCTAQSTATADALSDAGVYAVVPAKDGFGAAKGGTACLVLGRHVAIGGEVGRFRDAGVNLWPTQMGTGDCWNYAEKGKSFDARLADCGEPHTDQVIGTARAAAGMDCKKALAQGGKLCTNKFASSRASDTEHTVSGWLASEEEWNQGFSKVVCTVRRVTARGRASGYPTRPRSERSMGRRLPGVHRRFARRLPGSGSLPTLGLRGGRTYQWKADQRSSWGRCSPCSGADCWSGPRCGCGTASPSPSV
ncbi:septum formation family protein [Streptomyces sp. NPDC090798]|uniref:septum formation family protein n=1 Tax=Streptomyces sp. NPDC090798 TaxID=3365968 RepID=UPI0038194C19